MTEEKQTPSLHPWQMSTGQLDDNQPSNKPVRALAFGLPRTTLLMGLMFVAGIVWGIHAGRQYRPLIPERVDSTRIENVQRGLEKMNTEVSKNWAEKNNAKIEAVGLTRKFITRRSGQELDNPFRPFVPEEARALAAKTAAVADRRLGGVAKIVQIPGRQFIEELDRDQ